MLTDAEFDRQADRALEHFLTINSVGDLVPALDEYSFHALARWR